MKILSGNNINRDEWSALVQVSATGTWFQTPTAYDFYASMPELFKPFAVALACDPAGTQTRLRAICVGYVTVEKNPVKQFFTRRAIIIGGPVFANDCSNEEISALMSGIKSALLSGRDGVGSSPIYIETRNFNDYSQWKKAFAAAGFEYKQHLNFHVDCRDKETMWDRLSENRKRQIKKANGLVDSSLAISEAEILEWYAILTKLYRTKVKTPLWSVEFFLKAYRQGVGKFLLVKHDGKVIGGNMVVEWKRLAEGTIYEWFECGLNAEYKEQYPSVMATWAGMTLAQESGCARYDMMGAGEPNVPYGVRDFKSEFGGNLVEHGRFLYVIKPLLYQIGEFGVWLLKHVK